MSDTETTDRLLRESDIIRLIKERYGLSACGIIETIRDTPAYDEAKEGKSEYGGTHTTRLED